MYHYKELRRQLQESTVQVEQHKMQICELQMEVERLTKGKYIQSAYMPYL